nr:hypothetical protein [Desulfobulbaceae bacterium]
MVAGYPSKINAAQQIVKLLVLSLVVILSFMGCSDPEDPISKDPVQNLQPAENPLKSKKKVLLVSSYHLEYSWTSGITDAILRKFDATIDAEGRIDNTGSKVVVEIINMDTKRNPAVESIQQAALLVKNYIEKWQPDLVITTDDNAAKYVIVPYFKNSSLPFVFCGVNWDASEYGFPVANVTGMIEVQLVDQIIANLSKFAKGDRIAFLKGDDFSARKEAVFFEQRFNLKLIKKFVTSFDEWQKQYQLLQNEADIILVGNTISIPDWDHDKALQLVHQVTEVPTGNWDEFMKQFSLLTLATKAEEQGEWAAETSLRILNGISPSKIPIVKNHIAKIYLNLKLALTRLALQ